MRKIILASGSPRRREILGRTGIPFTVEPSGFEENMPQKVSPQQLVKRLAMGKAASVAVRHPNAIIIGADTVVALGKKVWSKPISKKEARMILKKLSGKGHDIWTGFAIIDTASGKSVVKAERTRHYFRKLSNRDIADYVARGESLDVAGAYSMQQNGTVLSAKVVGDYNNIIGLPLVAVLEELRKFGVK